MLYIRKHFNKTDVKFELINIPLFVEIRQVITGLSKTNLLELKSRSLPTLIINYEPIKNNFIKLSTSIFCFGDQYSSPPCLQRKNAVLQKWLLLRRQLSRIELNWCIWNLIWWDGGEGLTRGTLIPQNLMEIKSILYFSTNFLLTTFWR